MLAFLALVWFKTALNVILPSSVNLIALLKKLLNTCLSLTLSPPTILGKLSLNSVINFNPFCSDLAL